MTTIIVCYLTGQSVGLVIGFLAGKYWKRRRRSTPERTYGHPRPPVSRLRSKLPAAPAGHAWEISVVHDRDGTPWLTLALVNAATGSNIGEIEKDLVHGGYPWGTWAACYRNWSGILFDSDRVKKLDNDFLGPMVDWADAQVNKFSANQVGEYTIGNDT